MVDAKSDEALSLPDAQYRLFRFAKLIELLSGYECPITWDRVVVNGGANDRLFINDKVASAEDQEANDEDGRRLDELVPFAAVTGLLPDLVLQWDAVVDTYGDVVLSTLSRQEGLPVESRFLILANAVQTYCEVEGGRKATLRDALQRGLSRFELNADALEKIVDTRHYLTHYKPTLADGAASGAALLNLVDGLDVLNRALLLNKLGVAEATVVEWIDRSEPFRRMANMNRWTDL